MPRSSGLLFASGLVACGLPASAITIDFNAFEVGSQPTDLGGGVTLSAINASDASLSFPVIYDFDGNPELSFGGQQAPFLGGGNVDPGADLGNGVAILGPDPARILEGRRPAGQLVFDFSQPLSAFGFTVVDVEGPEEFPTEPGFFVAFASLGEEVLRVDFADFVTPGSAFFDESISFGNNSANRIGPIDAVLAGVASFDQVTIALGGSAVVDDVVAEPSVIPSPAAAGLGLVALGGLAARRRRPRSRA